MAIIKPKKTYNYRNGGNQYRKPLVFNGRNIKNKQPKKIKIPRLFWKILFYFILLLIAVYLVFFSKYFQINDIMIQGNNLVSEEDITRYVPKGGNIFLFNVNRARSQILTNNSEIKNVEIFRGIPNAVKIVVLEYDNKLIWETNGKRYLLSSQGKVTKQLNEGENFDYPRIVDSKNISVSPGDDLVSASFVSFINNINNNLFTITNLKPVYYEIPETTFDLYLYTDAGFYVKLNTVRSSSVQLNNLKKILVDKRESIKEYVDLRIDGLAYYK